VPNLVKIYFHSEKLQASQIHEQTNPPQHMAEIIIVIQQKNYTHTISSEI